MRVLVIAQYYPPDMGGGATRAYNVVRGLQRNGCDVSVISAAPHYPTGNIPPRYRWKPLRIDYQDGVKIVRTFVPPIKSEGIMKRIFLFLSFMISSLFAIFFLNRPDVVWVSNPNILGVFPGLFYKSINRCSLILNVDDLWPESLFDLGVSRKSFIGIIGEPLANIAYTKADAITPISPGYIDVIQRKYSIDQRKIHFLPGGVDTHIEQIRSKNESKTKTQVLYIGAFSPAYDFEQVFLAANELRRNSDIEFVLQGSGDLAKSLQRNFSKLRLPNLIILNKIVDREEVYQLLQDADILLLPLAGHDMIELGISSKIYEYQLAGKPIICCSKGQSARYIRTTNSGIVVNPGDFQGLAKSVILLVNDILLAKKLGLSGQNFVQQNLSLEKIGQQMRDIILEVGDLL